MLYASAGQPNELSRQRPRQIVVSFRADSLTGQHEAQRGRIVATLLILLVADHRLPPSSLKLVPTCCNV